MSGQQSKTEIRDARLLYIMVENQFATKEIARESRSHGIPIIFLS